MDRYSFLFGTDVAGAYGYLGMSKKLSSFLKDLGTLDTTAVADQIQNLLSGFQAMPGYETEKANTKPVAVRYAPMHLYQMEGMAGIKPFCALAVSGLENRPGRATQYTHVTVTSRETMRRAREGYNYLDLLFGTKLLSWQDVERHRQKTNKVNFDRLPSKVTPEIAGSDTIATIRAVEAIYSNKNVVIRLEPDVCFNGRWVPLLAGIYSLIQPRLATEVGFAAYEEPGKIDSLARKNSIRIFVVPAGANLDSVPRDFVILDLADGKGAAKLNPTPLAQTLLKWKNMPWDLRQSAMENVFAQEEDIQNSELFVQKSEAFFEAVRKLEDWMRDGSRKGSIRDLDGIYREYAACTNAVIPWAEDAFKQMLPGLLAPGHSLAQINAEQAARCFLSPEGAKKSDLDLYKFGRKFADVDAEQCFRLASEKLKGDFRRKEDALRAAHENQLREEQGKTAAAVAAGEEEQRKIRAAYELHQKSLCDQFERERDTLRTKHAAELAGKQGEIEKLTGEREQAFRELEAKHKAELQNLQAECEKKITAKDEENTFMKAAAEKQFRELRQKHMSEQTYLTEQYQADLQRLRTEWSEALAAEQRKTEAALAEVEKRRSEVATVAAERDGIAARLENAKGKYRELQMRQKDAEDRCRQAELAAREAAEKEADEHKKMRTAQADADASRAQAQAAEERAKISQRKLDGFLRRGIHGKSLQIGVGIGAGVTLLVAVVIAACVILLSKPARRPVETIPQTMVTETVQPTEVKTTTPATEAETAPVTTKAETVFATTEPTMATEETREAEGWMPEQLPDGIRLQTEDLSQWEDMLEEFEPVAQFLPNDQKDGATATGSCAVLFMRTENEPATTDKSAMTDKSATVDKSTTTGKSATTDQSATAETTQTSEDARDLQEQDEPQMILYAGDYVLMVFGRQKDIAQVWQIFNQLIPEKERIRIDLCLGNESIDIAPLLERALKEEQWWIEDPASSEKATEEKLSWTKQKPLLYGEVESAAVFLFDMNQISDMNFMDELEDHKFEVCLVKNWLVAAEAASVQTPTQ